MSAPREALEQLLSRCVDAHPECGVRLQGSLARNTERVDSDIDLTVVVPAGGLMRENELLAAANHWVMQLVEHQATGTRVDINWVTAPELLDLIARRGASAWYMFFRGTTLRDPLGLVASCESAIAGWFEAQPAVLQAWDEQQAKVEAFKRARTGPLEFPTQPAFLQHLATLGFERCRTR